MSDHVQKKLLLLGQSAISLKIVSFFGSVRISDCIEFDSVTAELTLFRIFEFEFGSKGAAITSSDLA